MADGSLEIENTLLARHAFEVIDIVLVFTVLMATSIRRWAPAKA